GRVLAPRVAVHELADHETPEGVLRILAAAAAGDGSVAPELLDRVEQAELPEEVTWTPDVREAFLEILRRGRSGVTALETLHRTGLLARFLPEWTAVRCRPQRDPYHRFTVDVHLVETLARAAELSAEPPPDDPLGPRAVEALDDRDG